MSEFIDVYRNSDIQFVIPTEEKIIYKNSLMSEHTITVPGIRTTSMLPIQLGDYILYKGIPFKLNVPPSLIINHEGYYSLTFESPKYTWYDKLFMHLGSNEFPYYGNARNIMQVFIDNINEIDPGWSLGEIAETADKHLTFVSSDQGLFCNEAIKQIAETFKLEFEEVGESGKVINMVAKVGRDTNISFEYGMNKGLFELQVQSVNDKNIVTKAYGYGGTKNLPLTYTGVNSRLTFPAKFHTNNIDLYRTREGKYVNDEIYPHREANATQVSNSSVYTISDSTLDFDLNNYKIEGGEVAKINFLSGELTGESFDITDYNHSTRTITYKPYTNSNNVLLPNLNFNAAVGDLYTLLNIDMPTQYKTAAEAQVDAETLTYVIENSVPQLEYTGVLDPLYLRDNDIKLQPGDRIRFKDTRYGFDNTIRITEISYPITFPELVTNQTAINITIANFITYTTQQRLKADVLQVKNAVKIVDLRRAENARRNSRNLIDLKDAIIDPDGNYYTDKIKPRSIESLYLSIGAVATNFDVSGVSFTPNYLGDPNAFVASAGQLIHYDLKISETQFIWEMQPFSIAGLIPESKYYLYAKINKSSLVGSWELSTEIKLVESVAGYYILQAGVLFPVKTGYRNHKITAGMVFIFGNQIVAGIMASIDENMFIDLTLGRLKLGDIASGLPGFNFNVDGNGGLDINGKVTIRNGSTGYNNIQDKPDLSQYTEAGYFNTVIAGLQSQIDGTIESFFYQYNPTTSNFPANEWNTPELKTKHGNDTFSNTTTGESWRWVLESGNWIWKVITDTATQQALLLAGQALSAADGKIRNFTVQPFTPYDIGDLWSNGADLFRCILARASGSFVLSDFGKATNYDSTQVVIDNGIVTAGGIRLGNSGGVNAGITGNGTAGTEVRFWAGNTFTNRNIAPYRVLQSGAVVMTNATIGSSAAGKRVEISSTENNMVFYNDEGIETCRIDDSVDSGQAGNPLGGLRAVTPTGNASFISGNGLFSNGSGMAFISATAGIQTNASIVGLLPLKNGDSDGLSAAVVGIDQSPAGNSQSFAGWFSGAVGLYGAQYIKLRIISANDNVEVNDYYIVSNGGSINLALPINPKQGRMLIIHNKGNQSVLTLTLNGAELRQVFYNQCCHYVFVGNDWITMPATL